MSDDVTTDSEPERYELAERVPYHFRIERRSFLQLLGGIVVLVAADVQGQESGRAAGGAAAPTDLAAWLHIAEDGTVTVYTGKVEIGQNIRTSLAQAVADELHVAVASIRLVMGDTDLTPFDRGTFGSLTTPRMAPQLRKAAATARLLLTELAASEWKVAVDRLSVADGQVRDTAGARAIGFGALTKGQKLLRSVPDAVEVTPVERWTIAGRSIPKLNGQEIVSGRHRYTSDVRREGMWFGKVLRPPSKDATLVSLDTTLASAMPGVTVVRDADFAGVAAARASVAARALAALKPVWRAVPQVPARVLFDHLRVAPGAGGGNESQRAAPEIVGSPAEILKSVQRRFESTYTVAYIAHVPLEPRAAVAEWTEGKLTVWTGTQRPFGVKGELAEAFHLPADKVRVVVPDTGSGYGGKHTGECAIEAARLAKAAGHPVKLVWTREEEFRWAYFRPAGVIDVRSAVDEAGVFRAWEFHNYNSGTSGISTPYEVPHKHVEFHAADSPLRQGSYRGLAATANHFAREAHVDEVASALGVDPLQFRLRNLKEPRLRAVLEAAAARFDWAGAKSGSGRGHGIACGLEKGGYTATCAEVEVASDGGVRVKRLATAFECGAIVNPDHLRNQVEGGVLMGVGGALFEAVDFDESGILNAQLSRYRVPRFSDIPMLDVILLDRKDLPSAGAGETPIVAVAPALAAAIFAATGVRLRSLPLAPNGLPRR